MTRVVFLAAVLLLKLVVVLQLKDHPLTQPDVGLDTSAYASLAKQVAEGDIWLAGQTYFVSPLYIYFLAGHLALADSFTAARVAQIALGMVAVWFIVVMARTWFGGRAGWIAGTLAALTGLFTFYESLILQASLDVFLTSAALLALTRGLQPAGRDTTDPTIWFLTSGVIFGVATLNRPNMLAAAVVIALAALATRRVKPAVALMAGILIGMAPVIIRNMLVTDDRSLVSSHGGLNFYIGNGEGATGFYRQVPGISPNIAGQERDTIRVASKALGRPVTQAEASDYFFDLGWQQIRERPGSAFALFARKLGYVFHAQHIALPYSFPFYAYDENTALRWYAVGPWLLIPLGLMGLASPLIRRGRRPTTSDRSAYLVWLSFVPGYATGVAVFFVAERYRLPVLVPLVVAAGGTLDQAIRLVTERRSKQLALPVGAFVLLFALANWSHGLHDGRWEEGLRMAERLVILGRYDDADERMKRIEPGEPYLGAARSAVGQQLLAVGQPARALPYLTDAVARNPNRPAFHYALGQALLKTGKPHDALPHLWRGFEGGVDVPLFGYDLALALKDTGDFARAVEVLRRIVPDDDAGADAWLRLGRLAAQSRAPDVADPFFARGAALAPDDAAARQQYGLNLLLLGRFDRAVVELAAAVRLNSRDPESLAHLAYCEAKLGRFTEAKQHADAALAIQPGHGLAQQVRAALR